MTEEGKELLQAMQSMFTTLNEKIDGVANEVKGVKMHIENVTDKNIQILAENHMNLIDKLNQAVHVSDKTLLYEIQMSALSTKVEKLEKEMEEIKNKTA